MWSDTLLAAERSYLVRLALWGVASASIGTALLLVITVRRVVAPIVTQFAIQTVAWGSAVLVVAAIGWHGSSMRDVAAATRLDRLTWFIAGVDLGVVGIGVVLGVGGWLMGHRLGVVGAGIGVLVQGLALLLLSLSFAANLARLV
jgi:hypothetical protein